MPKRDAPENCYWRGEVLWGRIKVAGQEYRWSLRTGHGPTALKRVEERRKELEAAVHYGEKRARYEVAFVAWATHLADQVSPKTAQRYAVSLRQLEGFLRPLHVDEIDRETVSDIVRARRASGASTATIRRDLSALSGFLSYCEDEDMREGNPALDRLRKLKERRDPIVLPNGEDVARVMARAPEGFRRLIAAARLTGCRQEELVTAERRRLDLRARQLTVIGKRNKLRVIPLSDEAFDLLRSTPASLGSKWLFWHHDGLPYANVSSRFRVFVLAAQKAAHAAQEEFHPFRFHDLRHLYAVEYLKGGGSIYDLQQILGHTSVKVTEIYLDYLTPEEVRAAKQGAAQKAALVQRFARAEIA